MNDMKEWIPAIDGFNKPVMLNMNLVVHVAKIEYSGHYDCMARAINGENYTLKEDVFDTAVVKIPKDIKLPKEAWGMVPQHISIVEKKPDWTSVKDDMPDEGKQVEVCTKDGQVYVSQVLCGKFAGDVVYWRNLPELPEDVQERIYENRRKRGLNQ